MRLSPRWFAIFVGLWGVIVALLVRETADSGCPLGSCPACGACLERPAFEVPAEEIRIA